MQKSCLYAKKGFCDYYVPSSVTNEVPHAAARVEKSISARGVILTTLAFIVLLFQSITACTNLLLSIGNQIAGNAPCFILSKKEPRKYAVFPRAFGVYVLGGRFAPFLPSVLGLRTL